MKHRHLEVSHTTPVAELGLEAIDDLLERGDLSDWRPLLREVRRDPWGVVSERILHLVDNHPMHGTASLWRSWIESHRIETSNDVGKALGVLRRKHGFTQQHIADRLGMTQPEVSKLERRRDIRVSTLASYVRALGGRVVVAARFAEGDEPVL